MIKVLNLVVLSIFSLAGCATVESNLVLPEAATAEAVTVTLSDNSSFSFSSAERVQAVVAHLAKYEEGWTRAWRNGGEERYQVAITQSSGDTFTLSVNTDSISLRNGGVKMRKLSEEDLRALDHEVLGDDPYRRFATLDFAYPEE